MPFLKQLVPILRLIVTSRTEIILENIALRQQLCVLSRRKRRPRLRGLDRVFWVWLSRIWDGWRSSLVIVKPETGTEIIAIPHVGGLHHRYTRRAA